MRQLCSILIAQLLLFAAAAGCEDYLDVNEDPNRATQIEGDLLLPTVLANVASNRAFEYGHINTFFVNIWASNGSAPIFIGPEQYILGSFTIANTWSGTYTTALKNLNLMVRQAEEHRPVRHNVAAQGEILKAYLFLNLTLLWERVPYTQALDGQAYPQPEFDDQETILRGLNEDLKASVRRIAPGAALGGVGDGDLIYKGNMQQWAMFANSLRLRILMILRNRDTGVDSEIEELLAFPLILENGDEARIPFFETTGNENNLWKVNNQFGGFLGAGEGNNFFFAGETLVELLKDLDDPRLSTYFFADPDAGGEFIGVPAGRTDMQNPASVHQNILRRDWPGRIATAAETRFFIAEYHAENNALGEAHNHYISGVERALNYFDGKPGEMPEADKSGYINSLPSVFSDREEALQAIHEQQYIELFDRAPENWTHWRRVKHPELQLPDNAQLGDFIRRFNYPSAEQSSNPNTPTNPPMESPMWFENE